MMKRETPWWQWLSLFVATTGRSDLLAFQIKRGYTGLSNLFRTKKEEAKAGSLAGTVGSALTLIALLVWEWNVLSITLGIFISFLAGMFTIRPTADWFYTRHGRSLRHDGTLTGFDYNQINIDEVHGMFLSALPLYVAQELGVPWRGSIVEAIWLVVAFVVFRVYDAKKVGLVRRAEQYFDGEFGVMFDDTVAGLQTAVMMSTPFFVWPAMDLMKIWFG